MNAAKLVLRYLVDKKLSTVLNIFLLSLGTAVIVILILFNRQLEERISANAKGIDLVVGAKGSPLQLILCSVFHVDFPTGNIKLRDTEAIVKNPLIKQVIPLSLGDNFKGYRLVGTTRNYADLYSGTLSTGAWFEKEMEVVAGATAARLGELKVGDRFASSHGLTSDGDHHDTNFIVTGILSPTNSVLDNLILTSVESVWHVHEHEKETEEEHKPVTNPYTLVPSVDRSDTIKEVTSLLIQFRNPMAAIQLPRFINSQTKMQAASPAFETARLFSILVIGIDVLEGFAYILIFISALSIFIALYNSLKERQYDLAIMRTMGASRLRLLISVMLEGTILTAIGTILGLLLGHSAVYAFSMAFDGSQKFGLTAFTLYSEEYFLVAASLLLGVVCSVVPAVQAYRVNIHNVLAGG